MSCHMHQPNSFVNTYLGYTMWDYETDARAALAEAAALSDRGGEAGQPRPQSRKGPRRAGCGAITNFLENVVEPERAGEEHAVRRLPRPRLELHGRLQARPPRQPARRGRHASSRSTIRRSSRRPSTCRTSTSRKGCTAPTATSRRTSMATGSSTASTATTSRSSARTATARSTRYTNLRTSGPAAPAGGTDLLLGTTPFGRRRFAWVNGKLYAALDARSDLQWEVVQVKDSVTPGNAHYNERSRVRQDACCRAARTTHSPTPTTR